MLQHIEQWRAMWQAGSSNRTSELAASCGDLRAVQTPAPARPAPNRRPPGDCAHGSPHPPNPNLRTINNRSRRTYNLVLVSGCPHSPWGRMRTIPHHPHSEIHWQHILGLAVVLSAALSTNTNIISGMLVFLCVCCDPLSMYYSLELPLRTQDFCRYYEVLNSFPLQCNYN